MASRAYYGCEFINYNSSDDVTHGDFVEMLAKTISYKPKLWNLVKFTLAQPSDGYEHKFHVIFNQIIDDTEFQEFADSFKHLQTTSTHGLEL